jgi:flagellar motility protein MotE (MotC chaperone)
MKAPAPKAKKRAGRKRARAGRGALTLVAGLLISSGVLRIGHDAGQAWARSDAAVDVSKLDPAPTAEACTSDEDMHKLLQSFRARETQIEAQENAIVERLQALKLADREVERKLVRLVAAEEELRATMALADTAAEGDIARLTKVYENMKPKQAAALFEEMTPEFAAGFLGRMRPEAAAGIMASLSPEAAHTFSVVLAGRNAGAPTE